MSIDLPIQIVITCQTAIQNNMLDCNTCTVNTRSHKLVM